MKTIKLLKNLTLFMVLALFSSACDEDVDKDDVLIKEYDGTYMGFGYAGTTKVVCWKMEVTKGIITGIGISGGDQGVIKGTVNADGQFTATAIMAGEGSTKINIIGTISGKILTGTWAEGDGNGTISGNKVIAAEVSQYNGTYSGYAYEDGGTTMLGSWKININNGFISPISTSADDDGPISGIVNAKGEIIAMTVVGGEDEDDVSLNVSATISGNNISGTWTNTVTSEHGTISGSKEAGGDVSMYNGTYLGFGYDGSTKVVCWKMEITNGVISGVGISGGDNGVITGSINANGYVAATAIMGDEGSTQINITATISGKDFTGTWTNADGNGTISGNKVTASEVSHYNGNYSGYAYEGTTRIGSWKFNINNGFITPIVTSEDDGAISGVVNSQGQITAMTLGGDDETIHISATISGNNISGTWTFAVNGDSGTLSGQKE